MGIRKILHARPFGLGYLFTLIAFFIVTVCLIDSRQAASFVGHTVVGFPFSYYYSGCWNSYYIWSGLLGNAVLGTIAALIGGLGTVLVVRKLSLPEFKESWDDFRTRWYL
jgi:hypothetical protein